MAKVVKTKRGSKVAAQPVAQDVDLRLTKLGLRMIEASTARYRANWWICREETPDNDEDAHDAFQDAWEAQIKATTAIVAAARRNPHEHLLDLAIAARCLHWPHGDVNKTEDLAKLSLIQALLALGGIDEKICDEDAVINAMGG